MEHIICLRTFTKASKDKSDFRNYKKNSKFYDQTNKKVISKMKGEINRFPVVEFVSLNSKKYSYIKEDDFEDKDKRN